MQNKVLYLLAGAVFGLAISCSGPSSPANGDPETTGIACGIGFGNSVIYADNTGNLFWCLTGEESLAAEPLGIQIPNAKHMAASYMGEDLVITVWDAQGFGYAVIGYGNNWVSTELGQF